MADLLIDIEHRSFEATLARCAELGGADLIFTSPPYPTEKPGAAGAAGAPTRDYGGDAPRHFLWEDYQRLGDLCYRALKPGGFCIVIIDGPIRIVDKAIGSERSTIAFRMAEDWRWTKRHDGLRFRYVEHESYLRLGMPGKFGPRRRSGWEPMHVLQRPGGDGYFDAWAVTEPAQTAGRPRSNAPSNTWVGAKKTGRKGELFFTQSERKTITSAVGAAPGGAAINNDVYGCGHPAPFSPYTAKVQVLSYSPPGGLVCDPFNGSGTTGVAAVMGGRNFVGGDLGARKEDGHRWAEIGRERALEALRGQTFLKLGEVAHA